MFTHKANPNQLVKTATRTNQLGRNNAANNASKRDERGSWLLGKGSGNVLPKRWIKNQAEALTPSHYLILAGTTEINVRRQGQYA